MNNTPQVSPPLSSGVTPSAAPSPSSAPLPSAPPPPSSERRFTIGEAAALARTKPHTVRYWEKKIPQLAAAAAAGRRNGRRVYTAADVDLLRRIQLMLADGGLTIEGAGAALSNAAAAGGGGAGGNGKAGGGCTASGCTASGGGGEAAAAGARAAERTAGIADLRRDIERVIDLL